jgi:hypothetical protein
MHFKINTSKIAHDTIDGETVIINFDSGIYYSFDKVGVSIWDLLSKGFSVEKIIEILQQKYTANDNEIETAVNNFISELKNESLLLPMEEEESADLKFELPILSEKIKFEIPSISKYNDMQELLLLDPIDDVDERGWPNKKPGV